MNNKDWVDLRFKIEKTLGIPEAAEDFLKKEATFFESGGTVASVSELILRRDDKIGIQLPHYPDAIGLRFTINDLIQLPVQEYYVEGRILWSYRLKEGDSWWVRAPRENFQQRIRRVWK